MQGEDQYAERTPDLVARIRAMREAADKAMDRFTCVADYDVRHVVGHGPKPSPVSIETTSAPPTDEPQKEPAIKNTSAEASIEFAPAPAERAGDGETS